MKKRDRERTESTAALPPRIPRRAAAGKPSVNAQLERLEGLLLEGMGGLSASIGELKNGAGAAPDAGRYHALSARLASLEESFARICNVVGRLDQEVQELKTRG